MCKINKITKSLLVLPLLIFILTIKVAQAERYSMPRSGNDLIGSIDSYHAGVGEAFVNISRRESIAYDELRAANPGVNAHKVRKSARLYIPGQYILPNLRPVGIIINVAERRLYYFHPNNRSVYTFPVAVGRPGWRTPEMRVKIVEKEVDPVWNVPKSIKAAAARKGRHLPNSVPPGPRNPLGKYAMRLTSRSYLIHGTNNPSTIGKRISSGCIRMYPEDIEKLYRLVSMHTPVQIVHQNNKAGWSGRSLYLESHKGSRDYPSVSARSAIFKALQQRGQDSYRINWNKVNQVVRQASGMPVLISY